MAQSLAINYLHIVFSTKYREPLIDQGIEGDLYAYLGGVCNELKCKPLKIGGYIDHVHVLCGLSKNIALAKLMEEMKGHSSRWIKTKGERYTNFYWQNGYGAFSVNPGQVDDVCYYIANQKRHHAGMDFKDEYLGFLKKYGLAYDERYLWD